MKSALTKPTNNYWIFQGIHGHDTVTESSYTVSYLNDNTDNVLGTADEVGIDEFISVNMPAEEESNNLNFITISVNSNNSDEQDITEKAM